MNNEEYDILVDNIIASQTTMVTKERFDTIYRHYNSINKLNGDIVECGVWRGGMSIFLAKLFQERNIWMCDSFEGFQPLDVAKHEYYGTERHLSGNVDLSIPYDLVVGNLSRFGLRPDDRINLLRGWVKDTLHPDHCSVKDIALLRVDVDAYSATLEVLDYLYDKVVPGGFIIFDDACLYETRDAVCDFLEQRGIENHLIHPTTDALINNPRKPDINDPSDWRSIGAETNLPCGSYMVKSL